MRLRRSFLHRVMAQRWLGYVGCAVSGSSAAGGCKQDLGATEFALVWTGRGHGKLDASDADGDRGADLEQGQAYGAAGRLGELRAPEPDAPHGAEQDIGHGG